jgi:pyruvate carboxylase
MEHRIHSLLIANRGEVAIRVMRAVAELRIRTVAIYSQEDRFSLHRTKADESYLVGAGKTPVEAYLDIADIVRIAREAKVDGSGASGDIAVKCFRSCASHLLFYASAIAHSACRDES